jgi:hypothetical protein
MDCFDSLSSGAHSRDPLAHNDCNLRIRIDRLLLLGTVEDEHIKIVQKQAFILAFSDTFYLLGAAPLSLVASLFLKKPGRLEMSAHQDYPAQTPEENDHETPHEFLPGRTRYHEGAGRAGSPGAGFRPRAIAN